MLSQTWESVPVNARYVDQLAFSPDGKMLATYCGRSSEPVKIWEITTGKQLHASEMIDLFELAGGRDKVDFLNCDPLFFTSDSKKLQFLGFVLALKSSRVVETEVLKSPLQQHEWQNVAINSDLQVAASTNRRVGIIKLWQVSDGTEIHRFCIEQEEELMDFYANQFSPDRKIFASVIYLRSEGGWKHKRNGGLRGSFGEIIKLWDVETGKEICSIPLPAVTGETKYRATFSFSSDSRILASNCGDIWRRDIVLFDTATGEELCHFQGFGNRKPEGLDRVVSLAFSPDNQYLASGDSTGTVTLWQLSKGWLRSFTVKKIRTFTSNCTRPNEGFLQSLTFSPDGQTLASGFGDNNSGVVLWDIGSGHKIKTFPGHTSGAGHQVSQELSHDGEVAVSLDGRMIATNDNSKGVIKLWDTQSGGLIRCLSYTSQRARLRSFVIVEPWRKFETIGKLAFSQNGRFLVGILDSNAPNLTPSQRIVWEVATGKKIELQHYPSQGEWGSRTVNQHGDLIAFFKESQKKYSWQLQIQVLEARTRYSLCTLTSNYEKVYQVVFSPDNRLLAMQHSSSDFAIWEIATSRLIRIISNAINTNIGEINGYDNDLNDPNPILFSPDGKLLAILTTENITLWQVSTGEKICTIRRYYIDKMGRCLAFSPNGRILASTEKTGSTPLTIKLWDVKTGIRIGELGHEPYGSIVTSLDFSGDGRTLVSSYSNGTIKVWQQKQG